MSYKDLVERSAKTTRRRREIERLLRNERPGSVRGSILYARLSGLAEEEHKLRQAVRNHPEHSYDGL